MKEMRDIWKFLLAAIVAIVISWFLFGYYTEKYKREIDELMADTISSLRIQTSRIDKIEKIVESLREKIVFDSNYPCFETLEEAMSRSGKLVLFTDYGNIYILIDQQIDPGHIGLYNIEEAGLSCWVKLPEYP